MAYITIKQTLRQLRQTRLFLKKMRFLSGFMLQYAQKHLELFHESELASCPSG
jgi:hypothetical protein